MKKIGFIFILVCVLLLAAGPMQAKKLAALPEVLKPQMIAVSGDKLFVTENITIFIYSLKDYKLIKKFGKEGEGPREFMNSPWGPGMIIFPLADKLLVNSTGKLSFFTQTGEYIKEIKVPPFMFLYPVKDKFIGNSTVANDKNQSLLTVNLYNSKLEKIKELYVSDMTVGPGATFDLPNCNPQH